MSRSTQKLKELIFSALEADSALETLLGGAGKIRHANPLQKSEYPCVVYSFGVNSDNPYSSDSPHSDIVNTRLRIEIFSTSTTSKEVDSIEDRVFELLHGQNLSNTDYLVYSCYRVTRESIYESDIEVWRTLARYTLINTPKSI